ncbi:BrnA antitoxin family protein [Sphingomonas sp. RP10(2022)]|uniref:BrnA antitoxin family protein n=1 Tax=Sphingomonas liriopis TaxID=2949094 RepID=A0A9X2HWX2_9SPHN|nr:BrnA antitoxin family protein [Sphingomonas liriopis]MCP3735726.1 BrnA antitoxin family protein [Sphingomonas liriopis]
MASAASTIAIKADPNDPEDGDITEEALQQALAERRERLRVRGAQAAPTKQQVTLRLDADILAKFRATGPGWQARINAALKAAQV